MFVYFKVNNYKSFAPLENINSDIDNNMLSMQYYPDKDFSEEEYKAENHINTKNSKYEKLSRKKAIYGNNGAGKSNFIDALKIFKIIVINSPTFDENDFQILFKPYAFVDNLSKSNTTFELGCIIDGRLFEYSITYSKGKIIAEQLKVDNESYIRRINQKITINFSKNDSLIKKVVKEETKPYQLTLSMICVYKKEDEIFNPLYQYIKNKIMILSDDMIPLRFIRSDYRVRKDKQNDFINRMLPYLKASDIGIDAVEFDAKDRLKSIHKIGDKIYKLDFYQTASQGSIKILEFAEYFDKILKNGGCLFVDEIEANKHPLNISYLLSYISSLETNKNNPQIVFTSHNGYLIEYVIDANQIAIIQKSPDAQYSRILELNKEDEDILTYNNLPVQNFIKKYYAGIFNGVPTSSGEELYNHILKATKLKEDKSSNKDNLKNDGE